MDKKQLRESILLKRKMLSPDEVRKASEAIVTVLKQMPLINESAVIMSYMPYGNEPDIRSFNRWILEKGKILLLPRVLNGSDMDTARVDDIDSGLVKSRFGILEPAPGLPLYPADNIDVILVPGVAFDIQGNRLGHGRGYYDRFLTRCGKKTVFLGIAYSFQVFDSIPSDQHDIRVHKVITGYKEDSSFGGHFL
ncbi:MAG TPA: 5-formyltetrahydrofolate cyclo-ligase [Clostridiaceae bacterium]|nr:5-formyltetrahydrofolate cyclo-ligase [Clostridiaceae bacterium]